MDGDRKYKQPGYQDSGNHTNGHHNGQHANGKSNGRDDRPRQPLDTTGPRLPRLVQSIAASRCFNCSTALPVGHDFKSNCPKCEAPLHCCKQCAHFESSTRFQCLKPIPERIAYKDRTNECSFFHAQVTVARDSPPPPVVPVAVPMIATAPPPPRRMTDARAAFEDLFKK
jgi:hypothetical protein